MRIFGLGPTELAICGCLFFFLLMAVVLVVVLSQSKRRAQPPVQSAPAAPTVAAGWLPDPTGRHQLRFWDGASWTSNVSDDGQQSQDSV